MNKSKYIDFDLIKRHPNKYNLTPNDIKRLKVLNWDKFWIGVAEDGNIDCHFTAYEDMCSYNFKEFYNLKDIEDKYDMQVQVNVIKWLNEMIDEGILGLPE